MIRSMRSIWCLLFVLLLSGQLAWGSPSGLNNIPTTDVVPENILVFQTYFNFANDMQTEEYFAFKYGVPGLEGLEIGIDWKGIGASHGHAALQAKYAFDIDEDFWKGVVGIANVSDHRPHNGEVFPYVATSVDLDLVRLHAGFAGQPHNEAFFAGIDRTLPFLNRNLQLKADVIQFNDMDDALFSVGFLYDFSPINDEPISSGWIGVLEEISRNIVLEVWVSIPSTSAEEVYTLKFNYVIRF